MESKNVKIIDEHGIDRDANIICGFKLDGHDYVLYWIERDNENDNLFVSKLANNIDGTSNMVNIEDMVEKSRIVDITKQLITFAINSSDDKCGNKVVLGNSEIEIFSARFNKEQNINVTKTYITTVKKTVVSVSEKFYYVDNIQTNEPLFNDVFDPLNNNNVVSKPSDLDNVNNSAESFMNDVISDVPPAVQSVTDVAVDDFANDVVNQNNQEISNGKSLDNNSFEVLPEISNNNVSSLNMTNNDSSSKLPNNVDLSFGAIPNTNADTINKIDNSVVPEVIAPSIEPVISTNDNTVSDLGKVDNVIPVTPISVEPISVNNATDNNVLGNTSPLVFDGAKETNLNVALGELGNNISENIAVVSDVDSLRQFGQHDNVVNDVKQTVTTNSNGNVGTNTPVKNDGGKNGGFANKKFFMVVAIILFVAACCFLGYEVYRYFQIVSQ